MKDFEVTDAIISRIRNNNYKPTLILVQGAPGSGKTTFAHALYTKAWLSSDEIEAQSFWAPIEADQFFSNGKLYQFDKKFIKYAHQYSLSHAAWALHHGCCVVVANTFTRTKDLDPYYELAQRAEADVILVRMCADYGNVHNVPDAVVEKHKQRLKANTKYTPDFLVDEN